MILRSWMDPDHRALSVLLQHHTDVSQLGLSTVAAAYKYKHYIDIITGAGYRWRLQRAIRENHNEWEGWRGEKKEKFCLKYPRGSAGTKDKCFQADLRDVWWGKDMSSYCM